MRISTIVQKKGDRINPNEQLNPIGDATPPLIRKPQSISLFMDRFKSSVNTKIQLIQPFSQSNYHNHIIRNREEYQRIKNYIINNPVAREYDMFNPNK